MPTPRDRRARHVGSAWPARGPRPSSPTVLHALAVIPPRAGRTFEGGEDGPDARRRGATTEAYAVVRRREERRANEADGPSSAPSYSLDDAFAEDAVGADHQRQDHQHVRREVFRAA